MQKRDPIHLMYNLGQKVGAKLTKLSQIGSSMECFTGDFLRFFTQNCQNLAFGWAAGYLPSNPSISGFFWKFSNFLRSLSLSFFLCGHVCPPSGESAVGIPHRSLSLKSFGNSWTTRALTFW